MENVIRFGPHEILWSTKLTHLFTQKFHINSIEIPPSIPQRIPWYLHEKFHVSPLNSMRYKTGTAVLQDRPIFFLFCKLPLLCTSL